LVVKQLGEQRALSEVAADLTHIAMLRLAAANFSLPHDVPAAAVGLQTGKVGWAADEPGQLPFVHSEIGA
jgi:hypothetical protein